MVQTNLQVKYLIRNFENRLSAIYPPGEIRHLIYMLFEFHLGWGKSKIHLSYDEVIPEPALILFMSALEELSNGKPVQYITGSAWFNGSLLAVNSNVLIPRPETAELCSLIKNDFKGMEQHHLSILDIGTGSGCISIDLKKEFPCSEVTATDVSMGALEVARKNALDNHCEMNFIQSDILNPSDWKGLGTYQLIVSNPPYVTASEKHLMHRNVLEYEPLQALFVPDDQPLLYYQAISTFAAEHLAPAGCLYFEINERFGKEVKSLLSSCGFIDVKIHADFHGKERFVSGKFMKV
jgi:release factor glutamine methyltransferase